MKENQQIENNTEKRLNEIESEVKKLEKTNFEGEGIHGIINPIEQLKNDKLDLIKFENEKINDNLKKKINELKNSISILLIEFFENYIPILKKENLEYMFAIPFEMNIFILKNYKEDLTEIKKELNDSKITYKIDELINNSKDDINNFLIKIIEIYLKKHKKDNFKNLYPPLIIWNMHHINFLKNCKKILTDLKKEINNEETANKIDKLIIKLKEDIPYLIIKLEEGNSKQEDSKAKIENKEENDINNNEIKINPEKESTQSIIENEIKNIEEMIAKTENNIKIEKQKNNLIGFRIEEYIYIYINYLSNLKLSIIENLKEKTNESKFKNIINELVNKIINLQISLIKEKTEEIEILKKTTKLDLYIMKGYIKCLSDLKFILEKLKKETNEDKFKNQIIEIIKDNDNLLLELFEKNISIIEQAFKENKISINYWDISNDFINFKIYIPTLIELEQKKEDESTKNKLTDLINIICISQIKLIKSEINNIEINLSKNNHNSYSFYIIPMIENFKTYLTTLINLEQKVYNESTRTKLIELIEVIYVLQTRLIETEINNIEEYIQKNQYDYKYIIEKIKKCQEILKDLMNIKNNKYIKNEINELKLKISNSKINLIENKITNLEKENIAYIDNKYSIMEHINSFNYFYKELEKFEQEAINSNIKNKNIELKNKIYNIIINKIEFKTNVIINKLKIKNNIKVLKYFKFVLVEIKQKIINDEMKDKIDEIIYTISSLLINLFDSKIINLQLNLSDTILNNLEHKDFKKIPKWKIKGYIKYLQNYKENNKPSSRSKESNKSIEKINAVLINLENIIKQFPEKNSDEMNTKLNEIESEIKEIETANLEKIETKGIKDYIAKLKNFRTTIIELEEENEINNKQTIEKINKLKNEIFKKELILNEKYITELEKNYSEKIDEINFKNKIESLNNYKLNLINVSSKSTENEIKNKFNELTKRVENIIDKINIFQSKKENLLLDFDNKYKEIENNINLLQSKINNIFNFKETKNSEVKNKYIIENKNTCDFIINNFYSYYDDLIKTLNLTKTFESEFLENKNKSEKLKEQFENAKTFYEESLNFVEYENIIKQIPEKNREGINNNLDEIENEIKKIETTNINNKLIYELEEIKNKLNEHRLNLEKLKKKSNQKFTIDKIILLENNINNLFEKILNIEIAMIKNNLDKINDQLYLNICKNYLLKIEKLKMKQKI